MEETGIYVNGEFIKCDIKNLEILIKGNVQKLNIGTNAQAVTTTNTHTVMNIGNVAQQFNGVISGGTFCMGTIINYSGDNEKIIEEIPSIRINVDGDINSLIANIGNVFCKNTNSTETTSGGVNVSGNVSGSVKSMSGGINVKGNVGGNASSMSGSVIVNKI